MDHQRLLISFLCFTQCSPPCSYYSRLFIILLFSCCCFFSSRGFCSTGEKTTLICGFSYFVLLEIYYRSVCFQQIHLTSGWFPNTSLKETNNSDTSQPFFLSLLIKILTCFNITKIFHLPSSSLFLYHFKQQQFVSVKSDVSVYSKIATSFSNTLS